MPLLKEDYSLSQQQGTREKREEPQAWLTDIGTYSVIEIKWGWVAYKWVKTNNIVADSLMKALPA